jgi:VIT1/CCC1 family predicted Fe2+/Mn2+ transporter
MHTTTRDQDTALQKHLHDEHDQSPLADYFKEVIYGGIDGIVTTFAVVAGFSGAALSNETTTQLSFLVVLLFGLANLFADGVSMGLGNFLAVKSEQDLYNAARDKEVDEVRNNAEMEYAETITIMMQKGFTQEQATTLADIYRSNETYWVDFMMTHELEMPDPRGDNPVYTGFATFASFLVFGAIPLLPFMFWGDSSPSALFTYSIFGTFAALVMLGLLKWKIVGSSLSKSLFEVIVVGGAAALIAFLVGTFFRV